MFVCFLDPGRLYGIRKNVEILDIPSKEPRDLREKLEARGEMVGDISMFFFSLQISGIF